MLKRVFAAVAILAMAGPAYAEKRIALVIGNSAYDTISPLANARNDAALMAATLKNVGFDVTTAIDVDYTGLRKAVQGFGKKLRVSGRDAVGLLYYAGHGVQARNTNYLVPIGAEIQTDADLELNALSAAQILAQMEAAGNAINLVILDACRNNPFRGRFRSGGRGLARVQAASGTLIAFAAAPGQVADDGTGANSPYTAALVDAINEPGLTVEQVFKKVRVKVEHQTGGNQTPWEESSLRGDFYFTEPARTSAPEPVQPLAAPQSDREALFWRSVKDSNNPALLQAYVDRYPDGTFAGLATIVIEQLKKQEAADKQRSANKVASRTPSAAPAAEKPRSPSEMVVVGLKYETGDGLDRDPEKAADWYRKAARAGSAEAKYRLALLHYHGVGVEPSYGEAAEHILGAIEAGHAAAVDALNSGAELSDPEFLMAVQRSLKALGYYTSRIDGDWGPGSRRALAAYAKGEPIEPVRPVIRRPERRERAQSQRQFRAPRREPAYEPPRQRKPVECVITSTGANNAFWNNCN